MKTKTRLTVMAACMLLIAFIAVGRAEAKKDEPSSEDKTGEMQRSMPRPVWRGRDAGDRFAQAREFLEELKSEQPEEFKRLQELRETDRKAFSTEIRKVMVAKRGKQRGPGAKARRGERKHMELSRRYHKATSAEEKERIKLEIREAVEESFEKTISQAKKRLVALEREIERARDRIERRQAQKAKICEDRVNDLTKDPALRWSSDR